MLYLFWLIVQFPKRHEFLLTDYPVVKSPFLTWANPIHHDLLTEIVPFDEYAYPHLGVRNKAFLWTVWHNPIA